MNDPVHTPTPRRDRRRLTAVAAAIATASLLLAGLSSTASAAEEELIVNGGFEDGLTGWFANGTTTLAIVPDAYSGTSAVKASGRTGTQAGPMQDLSGKVQPGGTYALKARIKYDSPTAPATKQFFVTMHYGGSTYTNLGTVTPARGQWGYVDTTFTIPAGQSTATARLFIETPWVNSATLQSDPTTHLMDITVDDVSLVGAPPPPPPSQTIEVVGKLPGDANPLIGWKFGADGTGFADGDRVYMYMTNDTQPYAPGANGVSPQIDYGKINKITLISSTDLVNWTDHGEIPVAGPQGIAPYTNNSWAPEVAKRTVDGVDKYFLYYGNGGGSTNVLTGDTPLGPWKAERTSTLINGSTPGAEDVAWKFDPSPLVDDDGQAYLYFGGGPASTSMPAAERFNNPKNIRVIKLGDDMISTEGTAQVVDTPVSFEAAQVFKREGKYYLSYSAHFGGSDFGGNQTPLPGYPSGGQTGYMISDSPTDFPKEKYAGVLFPNQSQFFGAGTGGNNHQSVFEFNDRYYFTYHGPTVNKRINGNTTQGYRSPHMQELSFNADGTIQQVVGDYKGVDQVRDFDPFRTFEAETIGWSKGIATERVMDGSTEFGATAPNLIVKDIDAGDWTALSSVAFGEAGAASVTVRAKALQPGGQIQVRSGSETGTVLGTIPVTGPVGEWTELTADLIGATGTQDVFFTYTGPSGDLFQLDTWSFAAAAAEPELSVSASVASRCVAGKAVVVVKTSNADEVPVSVSSATPFGVKSGEVAAGASATQSFVTRQASVDAFAVAVTATGTVGGEQVTTSLEVPSPAISCR